MNIYDFPHDFAHTTGYVDEDLDYELPDPVTAMHFKKKRSGAFSMLGAVIAVGTLFLYPTLGLKLPQKDNPFYYRKKFGTPTTIEQAQEISLLEYGNSIPMMPESYVNLGPDGFK